MNNDPVDLATMELNGNLSMQELHYLLECQFIDCIVERVPVCSLLACSEWFTEAIQTGGNGYYES